MIYNASIYMLIVKLYASPLSRTQKNSRKFLHALQSTAFFELRLSHVLRGQMEKQRTTGESPATSA